MYCPKCGKQVGAGDKFCPGCGAPLNGGGETIDVQPDETFSGSGNVPQRLDVNESGYRSFLDRLNAIVEGNSFLRWFRDKFWHWEGRLNRWAMLTNSLWLWLVTVGCGFVTGLVSITSVEVAALLGSALAVPVSVAQIFMGIRRCHDLNHGGIWLLIMFIPGINVLFSLYLWFWPGTHGDNDYGPDPLMS